MFGVDMQPLWDAVERVAAAHFSSKERSEEALAGAIRELSDAYTRRGGSLGGLRGQRRALLARLCFYLPRDLPKVWGPLSELRARGALPETEGPLRILDLGAGLGTTSLGAATLLARGPTARPLEITAVDADAEALRLMEALFSACEGAWDAPVTLRTRPRALGGGAGLPARGPHDLLLAGLVLNETLEDSADAEAEGAERLRGWTQMLSPQGAMIVIEPALRTQSRQLQAIRDLLCATPGPPHVFAPCTHRAPCPLLSRARDWCHERVPVALPAQLRPLAAAAGLRGEDLSYAYLTLSQWDRNLADDARGALLRGVGGALGSKGKTELSLCGPDGVVRLMQLDRTRADAAVDLGALGRGSLLELPREALGPDVQTLRTDRCGPLRLRRASSLPTSVLDPTGARPEPSE